MASKTLTGWVAANPELECTNCGDKHNLIDGRLKIDKQVDEDTQIEKDELNLVCQDCAE